MQHTHAVGSSIGLLRLCQALAPVLCDPDAVYAAQSIPTGHRLLHAPSSTASQPIMPHHLIWASVSLYYTTFADNVTSHITLRSNYGTFKGRCVGGSAEVERLLHNMKQSCGKALKDFCGRLYVQYVGIVNCSDVSCAKRGEFSVCVKLTVALLLDVIILEPVIDNLSKQTTSPGRPLTSATLLAEICA